MILNNLVKHIALCVFAFWCFSSHFLWAASVESISGEIQKREDLKLQWQKWSEKLVSKVDDTEDLDQMERELENAKEHIQECNTQIAQFQKYKEELEAVNAANAVNTASLTTPSVSYSAPEKSSGLGWWWLPVGMLIVFIVVNVLSELKKKLRPVHPTLEIPNHRFAENIPASRTSQNQPNQETVRLHNPKWVKSKASKDGRVPSDLVWRTRYWICIF